MDINLKTKLSKRSLIIIVEIVGIALCIGIYSFVDIDLNGTFVDWFTDKYMMTHETYSYEIGPVSYTHLDVYKRQYDYRVNDQAKDAIKPHGAQNQQD